MVVTETGASQNITNIDGLDRPRGHSRLGITVRFGQRFLRLTSNKLCASPHLADTSSTYERIGYVDWTGPCPV
jgi:hypothetical protein